VTSRTRASLLLPVVVLTAGLVGCAPPASPTGSAGQQLAGASPGPSGAIAIGTGAAANLSHPEAYAYVVLNAWDEAICRRLKAANPQLKCLVYKDAASTRSYPGAYDAATGTDVPLLPTGVGFAEARWHDRTHPEDPWFLLDTSGHRVEWDGYPGSWQLDIGSPSYQRRWRAAVAAELVATGWDGVVVDNVSATPGYLAGRVLAKYHDGRRYQAAMEGFLDATAPAITAAGKLHIANIANTGPELFAAWASRGSGGLRESWIGRAAPPPGGSLPCGSGWEWLSLYQIRTQAVGKVFLGQASQQPAGPPTDLAQIRYQRASFLVQWNGGGSASLYSTGTAADPFTSDATVNIGAPVEPKQAVEGAGFMRRYTRGIVIINRACSGAVTFELGGAYRRPDGVVVRSVELPGPSGMILTRP
jgi:Hypothetical glycosyl hydrolase family 15